MLESTLLEPVGLSMYTCMRMWWDTAGSAEMDGKGMHLETKAR